MSGTTLDRMETDATPFTLFWAEQASNDITNASDWIFSESTQGLTNFSATAQDKPKMTHDLDGDDGYDIMSVIG